MFSDSDEEEEQAAEGSAGQEVFSKEHAQSRESRERKVSTS